MDAPEAARPHEPDPDHGGSGERAADRGRADRSLDGAYRQVARPELARGGREPLQVVQVEPDQDAAVENADRRGDCPCRADSCLAGQAGLDAIRGWEAVGDE